MPNPELLPFFKALADASRLRMVGLLSLRPHSVEELSTVLELKASTVSHHLKRLSEAGLVRSEAQGHYHVYRLDLEALQAHAKTLSEPESLRASAQVEAEVDPFDAKVLRTFVDENGRIAQLPAKRKKFEVLLRYALRLFEDAGPWDEQEVNARLKTITADTASIRRGFIDHRLMKRERGGRDYQRV